MAARMEKTRHPGIYRRGGRYVVTFRDGDGKQRKQSARTLDEARRVKSAREADVARGEFHDQSRLRFREYAEEWVERYTGRARHGFRETTRDAYKRNLERYVYPYLDERRRLTLAQVNPRELANLIAWLCDEQAQAEHENELARREARKAEARGETPRRHKEVKAKRLSDSSIRNVLNPVRACLATAKAEGLIRHNPAQGLALPHRPVVDDADDEEVRPFTREQLATFLELVHARHRLLAATGLRVSEAIGLQWRHLVLDGSNPHVKVRRALVRGKGGKILEHPPKSRHGRRDVPLDAELVSELRRYRRDSEWPGEEHPVFSSEVGGPLSDGNVRRRHLAPAAEEVGAPWAGFHTFRHTFSAMHIARGTNVMQLSRLLGHHSAGFTLEVYGHLMDADRGAPLDLGAELASEPSGDAALDQPIMDVSRTGAGLAATG